MRRGTLLATAAALSALFFASSALAATKPANTSPPTISGTLQQGSTLTGSPGSWTGTTPIAYTYGWGRCSSTGTNCVAIAGATSQTYLLSSADVGSTMIFGLIATNIAGSAMAASAPTRSVVAATTSGGTGGTTGGGTSGGGTTSGGTVGTSLPAPLPASTGTTFYVSTSGSDSNAGTQGSPWRTIQKALSTLTAGQTAIVAAGSYAERLYTVRNGTASAPITIKGAAGTKPVITGRVKIQNDYIRVSGFKLQGQNSLSQDTLIYVSGGSHDEISGNEVYKSTESGIYLSGASDVRIVGNWIHDAGTHAVADHGIYWDSGTGGLIADNVIANSKAFGVHLYPDADNIIVTNNTITGSGKSGIIVSGTTGSASSGCTIVNNIVAYSAEWGIRSYYPGPVGSSLVEYNLGFGNPLGDFPSDTAVGVGLTYQNNTSGDPLFASGTSDVHLQAGSPAIDKALGAYAPTTDFDGRLRPQGAAADIGAFEK